jgi:hypothetical protein
MPALDDQIDDLFETYFYHVTTPGMWERIRTEGLRCGANGTIRALTTNHPVIVGRYAAQHLDGADVVVIRFNPCNLGMHKQIEPDDLSLPADRYLIEIRANMIGPLLLEKDAEMRIGRAADNIYSR